MEIRHCLLEAKKADTQADNHFGRLDPGRVQSCRAPSELRPTRDRPAGGMRLSRSTRRIPMLTCALVRRSRVPMTP